jgi:hypothetical protein
MRIARAAFGLFVIAILALATPPDSRAQTPSTLLIRGATIIDGVADAPLRDRALLIEGNTIRDVLPAGAAAPAGAQVLDLSGKFIIPGLFDSHVHWEEYMGELFVNHGVTSIVALENAPKALRARSQDALDLPRFFHPGGRLQLSNDASEGDIRQMVRTWFGNEPDFAWFAQYNDRNSRAYAIAADEAHKAGFVIFGHTDNAPGSVRDGMDIIEHIWGFAEAVMSPEQLRSFKEGKFLTWATFLTDWSKLDAMIADAVRRGAYLNPTLHYEWGGMSRRALQRELEDYRVLSNPASAGNGRSRTFLRATRIRRGSAACRRTIARNSRPASRTCSSSPDGTWQRVGRSTPARIRSREGPRASACITRWRYWSRPASRRCRRSKRRPHGRQSCCRAKTEAAARRKSARSDPAALPISSS